MTSRDNVTDLVGEMDPFNRLMVALPDNIFDESTSIVSIDDLSEMDIDSTSSANHASGHAVVDIGGLSTPMGKIASLNTCLGGSLSIRDMLQPVSPVDNYHVEPCANDDSSILSTPCASGSLLNVCPTCNKSFPLKRNLTRHQNIHSILKSFTCDVCQKDFSRRAHLNSHHRTHESVTPSQTFKCDICQVSFARKDNRVRHMRIHQHPQHKCSECNESYSGKNNFVCHIRTHQHSQYKCLVCDLTFARQASLVQHNRVSHVSRPSASGASLQHHIC